MVQIASAIAGIGQIGWLATRLNVSQRAGSKVTTGCPIPVWPIVPKEQRTDVGPNNTYPVTTIASTAVITEARRASTLEVSPRGAGLVALDVTE